MSDERHDDGGESACFAHLICPDVRRRLDGSAHVGGCAWMDAAERQVDPGRRRRSHTQRTETSTSASTRDSDVRIAKIRKSSGHDLTRHSGSITCYLISTKSIEIDLTLKDIPNEKSQCEESRSHASVAFLPLSLARDAVLLGRRLSETVNVVGYSIVASAYTALETAFHKTGRRAGCHLHQLLRRVDDPGRGRRRGPAG